VKILNSGIRNDDRIIVDCYRSLGSFAGSMKEDIEAQRRLLQNDALADQNKLNNNIDTLT